MSASIHSFARVLSFPGERRTSLVANEPTGEERRLKFRYPINLSVRFRSSSTESSFSGAGLVLNLSSGGVLVASKHRATEGALVELSIEWPSRLDGRIPLRLIAVGRVLRQAESHFAATLERYEFRTVKISRPSPD